ncbi:ABC transporter substrate-binding protein [Aeromicrobium sp. 9AM]|uniref:ABC transporter substrate-binding protein n=1 Tax=Aeromicrobium sp. 9AM TaxID=2653126 RepID=UPI0012F32B19|nr:ABC transporter substrate-binding protein [Aeromicrobium sp. 9AM]VXB61441.1 ABC-type branched-chain amino acid transport system, substrate-binding protein [Aeromicrobium sp. 9AM]
MRLIRSAQIAAAVAALTLATACTTDSGGSSSGTSDVKDASGNATTGNETYKLGVGIPLTGPAASYGEEFVMATEDGVKDANKKFAKDGIKIELTTADTQATAEGGISAMNKLGAVEKAPAVLTAWGPVVAAASPVAEDLGFALFNAGAQSPALIGSSPNLVNVVPMNDVQLSNFSQYLVKTKKYKKFAVIYVDNETGQGTSKAFKDSVETLGGKVVAQESIRQDATDATTQIAKVKDSGADFIYVQTLLVEGAATMKAYREAGLKTPIGGYAGEGESPVIRKAGGDAMNGFIYMSHIPKDLDGVTKLLDRIKAEDPKRVLTNASYDAYFYSVPFVYAEAIKELRSQGAPVTGENILAVLRKKKDITVPIVGPMDMTNKLTYVGPTIIRQVNDYRVDPMSDETIDSVDNG